MARPNERRRSGSRFNDPMAPQRRSRLVERETPTYRSAMEGLSVNFGQFYNMASRGISELQAAEHAKTMADIEQQNLKQQWEAASLALQGKELTEDQKKDLDYETVWKKTVGTNLGADLARDFAVFMAQQGSDVDPEAARQQFLQENLKNGQMFGTGDDLLDVSLLAQFKKNTDPIVHEHRLNAVRVQLEKGRMAKSAELANDLMSVTPESIPQHINEMAALMPGRENEAPGYVIAGMLNGVQGNQDRAAHLHWVINHEGSGTNGQSFAESFPDAYEKLDNQLTQDYLSGVSYEGIKMFEDVEDFYKENIDNPEVLASMLGRGGVLEQLTQNYGMKNRVDRLEAQIMDQLDALAERDVTFNRMVNMANHNEPLDDSLVTKNMGMFFDKVGIDPFQQPEEAAGWIAKWGVISGDLQKEFSAALNDNDPNRFAAALRFGLAIEEISGEKVALSMFTEAGDNAYLYGKRQAMLGRPIEEIHQQYIEGRRDIATARSMSWAEVTGKSSSEAFASAQEAVQDAIEDLYPGVTVDPTVMNDILEVAKTNHVVRNRGMVDWSDTVSDTVKAIAAHGRLSVTPGPNNTLTLSRTNVPKKVNKLDTDGLPLLDDDGQPVTENTVPFGKAVPNPQNAGVPEDTIETWERDKRTFVAAVPNLTGVDEDSLHLDDRSQFSLQGYYMVKRDTGTPVMFLGGQKITVNGETKTVPTDYNEAIDFFRELKFNIPTLEGEQPLLDSEPSVNRALQRQARASLEARGEALYNDDAFKRFHFAPIDPTGDQVGFYLLYKPGFRNRLPTIDEREREAREAARNRAGSSQSPRRFPNNPFRRALESGDNGNLPTE